MEDPLQDLSGLSLFSRSIAVPTGALKSTDSDDPDSIHEFMKSMELRSPEKYLEQAKSTIDSNRKLLDPEFASFITVNNEQEAGEIQRGRRPGLGRKKAQFTMIPNLSQPPLSSEPIRDAELSKDPKEFFAYFERREMAEKELRRLRGESVSDVIDFTLPRPERRRRPGLLGRTATYKHLYPSSMLPENDDTTMASQETVEEGLLGPVNSPLQQEAVDSRVELEKKLTGSIATSESKISMLFDELLGLKNLDSDEISSLVLKRLQIKATIMDEIPIPVIQDSRMNTKSRTALSDIQNLGQRVGGKALPKDKQVAKSAFQSLASSHSSVSPLAPISAFQKHIQQSNMSIDRFSSLDLSPPRNSSSFGDVDEQSNHLYTRRELMASSTSELTSMLPVVDDSTVDNPVSLEMVTDGKEQQYDESVKDQFSRPEVSNMTARSNADFGVDVNNDIVKNVVDVGEEAVSSVQVDANVENSSRIHTDHQAAGSDDGGEKVVDVGEEAASSAQVVANVENSSRIHTDYQAAGSDEGGEKVEIMSRNAEPFINDELTVERMKTKDHMTDHLNLAAAESSDIAEVISLQHTQNMEEPSEVYLNDQNSAEIRSVSDQRRKEVLHGQSLAERPLNDQRKAVPPQKGRKRKGAKEPLEMPLNDQTKAALPQKSRKRKGAKEPLEMPLNDQTKAVLPQKSRKRKEFSRRHSLAAAGTHWEAGVRKSSRIKMRPLEFWKGERFLYGRIHESLATVIGLKYASPGKESGHSFGEKRNLKVKSYVSDEHEELVKRVSLY